MQEVAAAGGFPSSSSSSSNSLLLLLFPRAFPLRRGHRGSPPSPAAGMMSKVRVSSSSGSPSLEQRMEARQQQQQSPPTKPSACRSLFGPVDHQELARELRRHRREQEEASRARWNFDFQRHRPLRGRYQWEALRSQALPDFYTRTRQLQADSSEGQQRKRPAVQDSFPPNKRANTTEEEEEEEEGEEAISEGSPGGASSEEQTPKKSRQRPT